MGNEKWVLVNDKLYQVSNILWVRPYKSGGRNTIDFTFVNNTYQTQDYTDESFIEMLKLLNIPEDYDFTYKVSTVY